MIDKPESSFSDDRDLNRAHLPTVADLLTEAGWAGVVVPKMGKKRGKSILKTDLGGVYVKVYRRSLGVVHLEQTSTQNKIGWTMDPLLAVKAPFVAFYWLWPPALAVCVLADLVAWFRTRLFAMSPDATVITYPGRSGPAHLTRNTQRSKAKEQWKSVSWWTFLDDLPLRVKRDWVLASWSEDQPERIRPGLAGLSGHRMTEIANHHANHPAWWDDHR